MPIAYFDCFHGAAGDMLLASLLDAGLPLSRLESCLAEGLSPVLAPATFSLHVEQTTSHGITGSRLHVHTYDPHASHRTWADIRAMLERAALPQRTQTTALQTFERLARAEAHVHGVAIDDVHFHEVGALDSIIDIVGVCAGIELLDIERVYCSALPTGGGWVSTQHGMLPVPAPATLALLAEAHAPTLPSPSHGELLTPTAAALLSQMAHFSQPPMRPHQIGYGFGQRECSRLNGLRVWLSTSDDQEPIDVASAPMHDHTSHHHDDHADVVEIRCNLDDATGELLAYTIEQLLVAGALDAWVAPLVMKKGRPGFQLACLARPSDVERLAQLMLGETPTLGVRFAPMARLVAERRSRTVETPWGPVRIKERVIEDVVCAYAPEYEDCAACARAHHIPLAEVYAAVLAAAAHAPATRR